MTFGQKIQLIRKQNNLTQEQLAAQLYVSRQAVSKWEQDTAMPDVEKLLLISRLFDVSLDYLLKEKIEASEIPSPRQPPGPVDTIINYCKKYGYFAGYGLIAYSLYCFVGYIITLVAVIFLSKPPAGFQPMDDYSGIFGSVYMMLGFYILLSLVGTVAGMYIAKYLKAKSEKYLSGGDIQ